MWMVLVDKASYGPASGQGLCWSPAFYKILVENMKI